MNIGFVVNIFWNNPARRGVVSFVSVSAGGTECKNGKTGKDGPLPVQGATIVFWFLRTKS